MMERLRRRLPGAAPEPLPSAYQAVELQQRLGRLAAEINSLDQQPGRNFADGHHSRAVSLAYQQTLDEACLLIGQPVEEPGPTHRIMAEARLMHAGWRW